MMMQYNPFKIFDFINQNEKIYDNNFIQLQKIGQGGFASVYRVVHKIDDTEYAVKQIHLKIKDVKDDLQKHYEKLIREARYLAQVNHPNVIRYFHSWIEVTEKKKSQKQEEQKKQALELSSFTSKNKNSSAQIQPINGAGTNQEQEIVLEKKDNEKKLSPPRDRNQIKIGLHPCNNIENNIQSSSQNGLLINNKAAQSQINNNANKMNGEQKLGSQNQKQKDNGNEIKAQHCNGQQNKNGNVVNNNNNNNKQQQNSNDSEDEYGDDDGNEDSNTFYFEDEYDNEIVFIEENSKSNNKDGSQQDISVGSSSNLNNSSNGGVHSNTPLDLNEQQQQSSQQQPQQSQPLQQAGMNSLSSNNSNNKQSTQNNLSQNPIIKNNNINNNRKSLQKQGSNSNQNDVQLKKNQKDQNKQQEQEGNQGNCNDESQENNSQSFNQNQSDFQLVFESFDNPKSFKKDQNDGNAKKGNNGNAKIEPNGINNKGKLLKIKESKDEEQQQEKNKQKNEKQEQKQQQQQQNNQQQDQDQQNRQQQQAAISISNTKSYERRKNKSMDYQTIGQKQREFQLDKYDEIIFYLQTELCNQTLAEYITNRNKKLFSMQSNNSVSQNSKNNNKNNPYLSSPRITHTESSHALNNNTNSNNSNNNNNTSLGNLALNYSYSASNDPYDILTPEYKHQAILILKEIIKGLYHIHHICKMVHRDLKPHNIFLTENMQVKIGDFGLVKKLSKLINPNQKVQYNDHQLYGKKHGNDNSGMKLTSTNNSFSGASTSPSETNSGYHDKLPFYLPKEEITSTCGTATYASPEQLSQKAEFFDHRADIYSLGIIILQLFHPMNTTMELVKTIQNCKKGDLPKNFCSRYPRLSEIIKDSLSNDPQKRPLLSKIEQTLQEMEILESQFHSEVLGKLIVSFEQEPSQVVKFCKIIRNCLYFYKNENSEKAENVYNIQECTMKQITGQHEIIEEIAVSHPIQQNFIIRANSSEKTLALYSLLLKYHMF